MEAYRMKLLMSLLVVWLALLGRDATLAAQEAGACAEGLRPFVDVTREAVCVPEVPQRIVAIHDINAGAQVLSLGGPLAGMASREEGFRNDVSRFFDLDGVVDVGTVYEPNLERILALQPDLIVHEGFDGQVFLIEENTLSALRAIAPVVAIDPFRPVEAVMADYQELLGEAATVSLDEQEATFAALLAEIEGVLGDDWARVTTSLVDVTAEGTLQAWGPTALVPLDILTRAGANWVAIQQEAGLEENGGYLGDVSLERIDEFNADLTLLDVRFAPDIVDNPLYQQLTAVRAGQVIVLDEPFSGTHYPNYIAVAERLLEALTALDAIDVDLIDEPDPEEAAACGEGLRLFTHEFLATDAVCIPQSPQRVIALDEGIMVNLIALGTTPAGVHDWSIRDFSAFLDTEAVASVGTPEGPNLEAMLNLNPDLIVAKAIHREWYGEEVMTAMEAMAPVVLSATDNTTWEEEFLLHGALLGQAEAAQGLLGVYEARLAEFRDLLRDQDIRIAIIRSRADAFNIYVGDYFIVDVIEAAGLRFPESFADLPSPNSISLEEIDILDSDYLFVMIRNDDEGAYFQQASAGPLWAFLPAVQQERVFVVDWSTWVAGWNIMGAHLVVDDLFRYFFRTPSTTPNPFQ
jgi:iron complex transport system substrate-binding protein